MRPIAIVAAVAENGVIGRDDGLAWRLRTDLRRFRAITLGKPVVMGRKTFASIGKPLPGRATIVLSRDPGFRAEGVETARSIDAALARADAVAEELGADEIVVAGGAEVYAQTLPLATRLRLTLVRATPEGDATFPAFDRSCFREIVREERSAGPEDEHAFAFVDLERVGPAFCG